MRPVHFQEPKIPGIAGAPPLCLPYWSRVEHTSDPEKVTCKRCLNLLARIVEHRLMPRAVLHLARPPFDDVKPSKAFSYCSRLVHVSLLTYTAAHVECELCLAAYKSESPDAVLKKWMKK